MTSPLDTILEPGYLDDLEARPLEEIRSKRAECQAIETTLSYLRRLVQGRLDIVGVELARRRGGGDPGDVSSLVEQLPQILADRLRAPGVGRLPQHLEPGDAVPDLEAELDEVTAGHDVSALPACSDDELATLLAGLESFEHKVSGLRRALFDRIDALQAELTRRYKSGEATVDSLLR
jgi:hypothetical protein